MKSVEVGDYVKICYRGRLEMHETFDSGEDCRTLEFQVGSKEVLKGLEEALVGMELKEHKTVTLSPDEAFGHRDEQLKRTFMRSELPFDFQGQPGDMVALRTDRGDEILAMVKDSDEEKVTIDLNHPLAGENVTFELIVEEIFDEIPPSLS
jgi:peptidylprolyl isomerase